MSFFFLSCHGDKICTTGVKYTSYWYTRPTNLKVNALFPELPYTSHTHFSSPSKHYRLGGSPTLAELGGVTGPSLLWANDFELYWFSIDLYHLFLSLVLTLMEISKCLHSNFGPVLCRYFTSLLPLYIVYVWHLCESSDSAMGKSNPNNEEACCPVSQNEYPLRYYTKTEWGSINRIVYTG